MGLEQQRKAALGALQSQIDVVQCSATVRSVKRLNPYLDGKFKVLRLTSFFFFPQS